MNHVKLNSASGRSPDTIVRGAHLSKLKKGGAASEWLCKGGLAPGESELERNVQIPS